MATVEEIQQYAYDTIDDFTVVANETAALLSSQADAIADSWNFIDFDTSRSSTNDVSDTDGPGTIEGLDELQDIVFNAAPGDLLNDTFKKHIYESAFFTFLEPKLIEFITEESTGIDSDVQNALFDDMYERDLRTLNDALDQIERMHGGRGFPMPTSMLMAARNDATAKYQDTKDNRNREVTALIAERAQQNVHHAIDAGIKMEDIQSRFTIAFAQNWVSTLNFIIAQYNAEVAAAVATIDASIKEQTLIVQSNIANGTIREGNADRHIEQYKVTTQNEIQETKALIDQAIERYKMQLEGTGAVMEYYNASVSSALNQINGLSIVQE